MCAGAANERTKDSSPCAKLQFREKLKPVLIRNLMNRPVQPTLSIADLSIAHSVFEARYDMAFLIFDRTGTVCSECAERYPDLRLSQASSAVTSFFVDNFSFSVEQTMSRVVLGDARHDPKEFGRRTKPFFDIVLRQLEISVITRIGLRQVYFQTFADSDGAADFIRSLKLDTEPADKHFGISSPAREMVLRWESSPNGAMLHLMAIPGPAVTQVADVRLVEKGFGETYKSVLVFDVDYYTTTSVPRSQFDSEEWIANSSHIIKKGLRSFLDQCQAQ